jgi:hypothetical protein
LYPADPGSAGMPATFIAWDGTNQVSSIDAHTGQILRTLLPGSSTRDVFAAAADSNDVYIATAANNDTDNPPKQTASATIVRVPLAGGPPTTIADSQPAAAIAVSPDQTRLAWAAGSNQGPQPPTVVGQTVTVVVDTLATGVLRTWKINAAPGESGQDVEPAALTWTDNTTVALLTNTSQLCDSTGTCTLGAAQLALIDTRSPSATTPTARTLPIPHNTQGPGIGGTNVDYFTAGPNPDTLLVAASNTDAPTIYLLSDIRGLVRARALYTLPSGAAPTSLDADRHDLLLIVDNGPGGNTLARTTDNQTPALLNRNSNAWFGTVW